MVTIKANLGGKKSDPYRTTSVESYRGNKIAEIERFPTVKINSALEKNRKSKNNLQDTDIDQVIEIMQEAGNIFKKQSLGPGNMSFEEYAENVSKSTGLPIKNVRRSADIIQNSFKEIRSSLAAQSPMGDIKALDKGYYTISTGQKAGYVRKGENLGILAPGNHPSVISLALISYASKYPIAISPSDKEPFTPARVVKALYKAGSPENTIYMLPGDREVGSKIVEDSDRAIGFGGNTLKSKYSDRSDIKVHGPGNSKIFVDKGFEDDEAVYRMMEEAMMRDGGRGCINMSHILTTGNAEEIADKMASKVIDNQILMPTSEDAVIPASPSPKRAKNINQLIQQDLTSSNAKDISRKLRDNKERLVQKNGATFLRPTVLLLEENAVTEGNRLFKEYPFQYCTVTEISEDKLDDKLSDTLTLSMFTNDEEKIEAALRDPSIEKVYASQVTTCDIDLNEPHEGYLLDFLFKKKAFRPSR